MNPPFAPDDQVETMSAQEYDKAVDSTLAKSGYTVEQLREQDRRHDFDSPFAFMLWGMVKASGRA